VTGKGLTKAKIFISAFFALVSTSAFGHDQWADGAIVPGWVKAACCGQTDAHHLKPEQVHRNGAGDWVVDIFPHPIPNRFALPSQDGEYWLFFGYIAGDPTLRCFFVPVEF
jgi:hypothetical protein